MVFNVAKSGRCDNVGIFVVFNVAKLGWCHKDSILMPVLTSQCENCMSIYVELVVGYPPHPLFSHQRNNVKCKSKDLIYT
jgi:hypothetical protein